MAIYKLDVEKKFGQLRFRLYPQGGASGEFGGDAAEMSAFLTNLDGALGELDLKEGGDSIIFRNIEYAQNLALRETVRLSKF